MGLQSAPAAWQAFMSSLFADMRAVQAYMDDLIIASYTFKEHVGSLRTVFKRFLEAGVKLKLKKCRFGEAEVSFLGHVVSRDGIRVDPEKVRAMSEFPEPSTPRKLSRFLGMIGFHRRFIPNFAKRSVALRALLEEHELPKRKGARRADDPEFGTDRDPPFPEGAWQEVHKQEFQELKALLLRAPILQPPDFSKAFIMETDASNLGLGAVLLQKGAQDTVEHPISYLSRALTPSEKRYDTSNKEGLAIVWACQEYRCYLLGKRFLIRSDHQPLSWALNLSDPSMTRDKRQTSRLLHWAVFLEEYDFDIVHKPGVSMLFADPLSRDLPRVTRPESEEEETRYRAQQLAEANAKHAMNGVHLQLIRIAAATAVAEQTNEGVCFTVKATVGAASVEAQEEEQPEMETEEEKGVPQAPQPLPSPAEMKKAQEDDEVLGPVMDYLEFDNVHPSWDEWSKGRRDRWLAEANEFTRSPTNGLLYRVMEAREEPAGVGWVKQPALLLAIPHGKAAKGPNGIIARLITAMHDDPMQAHFGFAKTLVKMQERFWWPDMAIDVRKHTKSCERCQKVKTRVPKYGNRLTSISVEEPFEILNADFIEELPETLREKFRHILVLIDKFSKWPEFIPVRTKEAKELSDALMSHWITLYGVPRTIISDNGAQFLSAAWKLTTSHLGIDHRLTSPYHPQSNSQVERLNRVVKEALRALCAEKPETWNEHCLRVSHCGA